MLSQFRKFEQVLIQCSDLGDLFCTGRFSLFENIIHHVFHACIVSKSTGRGNRKSTLNYNKVNYEQLQCRLQSNSMSTTNKYDADLPCQGSKVSTENKSTSLFTGTRGSTAFHGLSRCQRRIGGADWVKYKKPV